MAEDSKFVVESWRGIGRDAELGSVHVLTCSCSRNTTCKRKKKNGVVERLVRKDHVVEDDPVIVPLCACPTKSSTAL